MAATIMPPMIHQTMGLPVLLSCSASAEVSLTLLPEASNSSRPITASSSSSEDALPVSLEEVSGVEEDIWLSDGLEAGVWTADALVSDCSGSGSCAGCSTFTLVTKSPEPDWRFPTVM